MLSSDITWQKTDLPGSACRFLCGTIVEPFRADLSGTRAVQAGLTAGQVAEAENRARTFRPKVYVPLVVVAPLPGAAGAGLGD